MSDRVTAGLSATPLVVDGRPHRSTPGAELNELNELNELDVIAVESPLLLTTQDAAAALSISRTTLYGLITDGAIRPVHIGRSCRISTTELRRYVEQLQSAS